MTFLLSVVVLIAVVAALIFGLANYWANTPHGRIKPIFALVFRLAPLTNPAGAERALGAAEMDTPEQVAKVRADFHRNTAPLSKPEKFAGQIEDRTLPGAPGGELPVRIYRPDAAQGGEPLPLIVYYHGGGFVVGSPDYTDVATRILAASTPAIVVSVDYRMGPEDRFPAAVDDCEFALNWCFENASALGARSGPIAVAGDSAGGNLSAVVSLRDMEAARGRVGLQVLIYPTVDLARKDRPSQIAFNSGYGLSGKDLDDCMRYYLPPGTDRETPDLSPLYAKSMAGLPSAYVITAGFDVLRDEGIAYVEALREAGVAVKHVSEPTLPHGYITMTRLCSEARASLEAIAGEVRAMS
jgi:acetyl esterase